MSSAECPTDEVLAAFHAGDCTSHEAAAIRDHARVCPRCARWLRDCVRNEEIFPQVADALKSGETTIATASDSVANRPEVEQPSGPTATILHGYRIVGVLGHGGQGTVYQATQESTKRQVAIKVLLAGSHASPAAQRRFEREIELAASLAHSSIVTVLDSGKTDDGHLFCVMEFVDGVPLDEYVRRMVLDLEQTVTLFRAVCQGVAAAHRRGVIHRDLKPSNILVDKDGNPRILDFGLAKPANARADSVASLAGQLIGTLPYASPEHVGAEPNAIDIRSDVYALGVILYRLLTGAFPYPVLGQLEDVLRHIAKMPPVPPTRNWRSDSGVAHRSSRGRRLGSCPINTELETIVLKALSKEPDRRYQTAEELERDLSHYLAGEPIDAKRDSGAYVLGKILRRNRHHIMWILAVLVVTAAFVMRRAEERAVAQLLHRIAEATADHSRMEVDLGILQGLSGFLEDYPGAIKRYGLRELRDRFDTAVAVKIKNAILRYDVRPVAEALVNTPGSNAEIDRIGHDWPQDLRTQLAAWLRVPLSAGQYRTVEQCADALSNLDLEQA